MSPSSNPSNTTASSGSSGGCMVIEDKKRRRMDSNRESARRSRQRKQQHLDDLIKQVGNFTRQNEEITKKIDEVSGVLETFDKQNNGLKTLKDKLEAKLESLESVIEMSKVVGGSNDDIENYDLGDPLMKPWQLPCPSMPIIDATSGFNTFKF